MRPISRSRSSGRRCTTCGSRRGRRQLGRGHPDPAGRERLSVQLRDGRRIQPLQEHLRPGLPDRAAEGSSGNERQRAGRADREGPGPGAGRGLGAYRLRSSPSEIQLLSSMPSARRSRSPCGACFGARIWTHGELCVAARLCAARPSLAPQNGRPVDDQGLSGEGVLAVTGLAMTTLVPSGTCAKA